MADVDPGSPPPSAAEVKRWNEIGSKIRHHAHIYHMHDGDQDSVDVRRAYESVRAAVSRLVRAKEEAERANEQFKGWLAKNMPDLWRDSGTQHAPSHLMIVALDMLLRSNAELRAALAATERDLDAAEEQAATNCDEVLALRERLAAAEQTARYEADQARREREGEYKRGFDDGYGATIDLAQKEAHARGRAEGREEGGKAGEIISGIYFAIAEEAIGSDEVRRRFAERFEAIRALRAGEEGTP